MKPSKSIALSDDRQSVLVLDQRLLPHRTSIVDLRSLEEVVDAIKTMVVRGAPLIGVTAAFGVYLAAKEHGKTGESIHAYLAEAETLLKSARPTAVNLAWAVDRQMEIVEKNNDPGKLVELLLNNALTIMADDIAMCKRIGEHGLPLIKELAEKKNGSAVNILTHCNAGRLACVEYGTATSPIYLAHERGIDLHVWVDETRPRNQGAKLTAFELGEAGIPHTVIVDNAAGHLMQKGMVDIVFVGCDRLASNGDACNKIGTYTKALAANDNAIPFYVALPSSTIDWSLEDGRAIPIEERSGDEVRVVSGVDPDAPASSHSSLQITASETPVANYAFDVTPARLISGIITEKGICDANPNAIAQRFSERTIDA